MTIGVFALQGDVSEHVNAMRRAMDSLGYGGEVISIRKERDLAGVDGAILPGGESTTIYRMLRDFELFEPLRERCVKEKFPVFGTCAGMVLLAKEGDDQVAKTKTRLLGLIDAEVCRNAFGRQKESFETHIDIPGLDTPFPAVFIRAPAYVRTWGETEVLATFKGKVILARQENVLASAFHPELTRDFRIHRLFLDRFASTG